MRASSVLRSAAVAAVLAIGATAFAVPFNETESNDTKATANVVGPLSVGDTLNGNSVLATGAGVDYFDVRFATQPLGIYRNRLVINSQIAGHSASIRGVGQTAAPVDTLPGTPWDGVVGTPNTTETSFQSTSTTTTPARFNQWYSFGKGERFIYRINGAAATTADYSVSYEQTPVTPTPIGTYAPGQISITTFNQGHTTDTDMWVYDANLNPIAGYGNDDEAVVGGSPGTGASLQSFLSRPYAAGTYYLALTNFAFANNQASPSDDDFRTGAVMDFAGLALNGNTTTALDMAFTISDGTTSLQVPNTKVGAYDVNWFTFTVGQVPEPSSLALVGLAGLAVARRRRH